MQGKQQGNSLPTDQTKTSGEYVKGELIPSNKNDLAMKYIWDWKCDDSDIASSAALVQAVC
jgi:hypothetical protein